MADYTAIGRVSRHATLADTKFVVFHADARGVDEPPHAEWSEQSFIGFRSDIRRPPSDGTFAVRSSILIVYTTDEDYSEDAGPPEFEDGGAPDIWLEIELELTYDLEPGVEPEASDLEEFASVNGTLHAWPYWREAIQSTTTRLGLPALVIGTYRVPPPSLEPGDDDDDDGDEE